VEIKAKLYCLADRVLSAFRLPEGLYIDVPVIY